MEQEIRKFWLRDDDHHPRALIAYQVTVADCFGGTTQAIRWTASVYRPDDQKINPFSRKVAHSMVEQRLTEPGGKPCDSCRTITPMPTGRDPRIAIVEQIGQLRLHNLVKSTPGWSRLCELAHAYWVSRVP